MRAPGNPKGNPADPVDNSQPPHLHLHLHLHPKGSRRCGWRNRGLFRMTEVSKAKALTREEHEVSSENDEKNSAEVTQPAISDDLHCQSESVHQPHWWKADPTDRGRYQCPGTAEAEMTPENMHHLDTLNLTGEGNPEPEPLRSVIDYLTDAAWRVNWKPDDKHPLQARYDALRSLVSVYAYATLVSLETLQRTDPGAADRVAEHLGHDDWDVRAECALLWHESLTGGARYAPFDEELHLLAGHHDLAIRQQVAEEIALAIERSEDDARRAEKETRDPVWFNIATGYMRSAEIAREIAAGTASARTGAPATTDLPSTPQALSKRLPGATA